LVSEKQHAGKVPHIVSHVLRLRRSDETLKFEVQ